MASLYLLAGCLRTFTVVATNHTPCVLFEDIMGIPMRLEVGELREGFGGETEGQQVLCPWLKPVQLLRAVALASS